jgi:transcriptional regulator with XRE-family HTH domain
MKLPEWLKSVDRSPEWLAGQLRVSQVAVWRYLNGERRPDWKVMQRIVDVTGAAVTANDYLDDPVPIKKRRRSKRPASDARPAA